jgi:hypothetical protein
MPPHLHLEHGSNAVLDEASHHGTSIARAHYAITENDLPFLTVDAIWQHRAVAREWHNICGVGLRRPPKPLRAPADSNRRVDESARQALERLVATYTAEAAAGMLHQVKDVMKDEILPTLVQQAVAAISAHQQGCLVASGDQEPFQPVWARRPSSTSSLPASSLEATSFTSLPDTEPSSPLYPSSSAGLLSPRRPSLLPFMSGIPPPGSRTFSSASGKGLADDRAPRRHGAAALFDSDVVLKSSPRGRNFSSAATKRPLPSLYQSKGLIQPSDGVIDLTRSSDSASKGGSSPAIAGQRSDRDSLYMPSSHEGGSTDDVYEPDDDGSSSSIVEISDWDGSSDHSTIVISSSSDKPVGPKSAKRAGFRPLFDSDQFLTSPPLSGVTPLPKASVQPRRPTKRRKLTAPSKPDGSSSSAASDWEDLQAQVRRGLQLVFGDRKAKEKSHEQLEYLVSCLRGNEDAVVIMATGGGKSAGWHVVAKLQPDVVSIVILPYVLLLQDQLQIADRLGIVAAQYKVTGPILPDGVQIVFVQPETVASKGFKRQVFCTTFCP